MLRAQQAFGCLSLALTILVLTFPKEAVGTDVTQRAFLTQLLKDYDVNEWPNIDASKSTEVKVQIFVNSFGSLNAANMDYSVDVFLRQKWMDSRLRSVFPGNRKSFTITNPMMVNKIWKPDTFFQNVKEAKIHQVTMPNVLLRLSNTGEVLYSMRGTMLLSCPMNFRDYPFDDQMCNIDIGSYANTDDIIKYFWEDDLPIDMPDDLEIAQFDLLNYKTFEKNYEYVTGNFSGLRVQFHVKRQNGFHILQTYVPTILIVSISWVSFWLDANAVPGRVSLGVTTLLTLTTLAAGIRQSLPPVSYIKAIDVWVGMCMFMVFGALLEFTVANWLANQKVNSNVLACGMDASGDGPPKTYKRQADILDRCCRGLFPGIFFVFNLAYWPYYLAETQDPAVM